MIVQFHTPQGVLTIDSETVTDAELTQFGFTRDKFNLAFGILDCERAMALLTTSPSVITMPEIWELLRIFGRRLGYHPP